MSKTARDRHKYWGHWCRYVSLFQCDPFLTFEKPLDAIDIVCAFAARVRTGAFGRGRQVKVQACTDAIAAINQTIQLVGQQTPLYKAEQKYQLTIERMVEGFRREDPPATPQLAVPITVPNACYEAGLKSSKQELRTAGCLSLVAFYFLLRVGEYTQPRTVLRDGKRIRATRTKQFSFSNVGFYKNGKVVKRQSSLDTLLSCDAVTLKITNQKNGRMGQTIHQQSTGTDLCPVKALAFIIDHLNQHRKGSEDPLLCDYYENDKWHSVQSALIVKVVRTAAKLLNLGDQGIDPDLIGAHSLRAGGAMALRLNGYDDTTIMKMGRWTSLTFTQYIHNQIAHLATDMSRKMSMPLPFLNIASIERFSTPMHA